MSKKIKILHILCDSNIGGAGRLLYNLSSCIDRNRFNFVFIFFKESRLIKLFKPLGFKIYLAENCKDRSFDINFIFEAREIIRNELPDIVHTHSSLSGRIASILAGIPRSGNIYTKHCVFDVPTIRKTLPSRIIYRIIDDFLSGKVIAVADAARDELITLGVKKSKIEVIINGAHKINKTTKKEQEALRKRLGIHENDFVVGISARLEEYKGHIYFLKAALYAMKNGDKIKFLILGDGSMRSRLENFAKNMGLIESNTVIFLGFKEDITKYINLFDVNVNCSIGTETSSLSISEALSIGKPAIVSDYGGNPNMIKHGITGFVIKKQDPSALYNSIIKLKSNENHIYDIFSSNAEKDYNERFSDKKMTTEYEKMYFKIARNRYVSIDKMPEI